MTSNAAAGPSGPLTGLRVVELAGIGPGPLACRLLADLGAEVLRVERTGPGAIDDGLGSGRAVWRLDLKSEAERERLLDVVASADVLVEGFRPGAAERLGLGPDVCTARNPRLVYARMTGWGQDGPLASTAGHDINYLSLTGALHAIGEADRKPVVPLNLVADFGGGTMFAVSGILAALWSRQHSGQGQVVDVAMVDGVSYLMAMTWTYRGWGIWKDARAANLLDGGAPFYDTYTCADGRHVAVGCIEPQFYAAMLAGLAAHGVAVDALPPQADQARWPELRAALTEAFAGRSRDDWAATFAGTDACVTPVLSLDEATRAEHVTARGTLRTVDGRTSPAPAPRFSGTPAAGAPHGAEPSAEDLLARWAAPPSA